jgi:hypothetical protein
MQETIEENQIQYFAVIFALLFIACIGLLIIMLSKKKCNANESYNSLNVIDTSDYPTHFKFNNNRVFACMTTIPERLETPWFTKSIVRTLRMLRRSNVYLFLSIPYKKRVGGDVYKIPDFLLNLSKRNRRLIIYRCNDYGPVTKLSGPLLSDLVPKDACIVICDDDQLYTELLFVRLAIAAYNNPLNVISPQPVKKLYTNKKGKVLRKEGPYNLDTTSDEIMGFQGFAFIKKLLIPILDIDIPDSCFRIDDHTISFYMMKEKIYIKYLEPNRGKQRKYILKQEELDGTIPEWPKLNEDEIDDKRYKLSLECRDRFNLKD